jgi:hypothetical protein
MTPSVPVTTDTRADRMRLPSADQVAAATAEQHHVCIRPMIMQVGDTDTGELRYVATPCGSTVETVCPTCARKARALRMVQCREGWHLDKDPDFTPEPPTAQQKDLLTKRADLISDYRQHVANGEGSEAEEIRESVRQLDESLRATGMRGKLPPVDVPEKSARKRSTKRRQDAPNLPKAPMRKTTIGAQYAGKYRPSTFATFTCDTYGPVHSDGTPRDPQNYDYRRAARDAVHWAALTDRLWQNLRRVTGYEVQYFGTVEPQKRFAPHLHAAIRGAISHKLLRQVVEATYHQVWWPNHDELVYSKDNAPVWDDNTRLFVDPDTREPLQDWDSAVDDLEDPAHVVMFGSQVHSKGILGGTEEAGRHIGYLTKYLVKSVAEVITADSVRQENHAARLHQELAVTPCSSRCAVWLLYGIQPKGCSARTEPGHCKAKAHRRDTLGLPGRRVLVSRKWSGKSLQDHKKDRADFVRQALSAIGINKPAPDPKKFIWRKVEPGATDVPPRAHLIMHAIAERTRWKAEYDRAMLAAHGSHLSATSTTTERTAA